VGPFSFRSHWINTMYRCVARAALALLPALPGLAVATALLAVAPSASAQFTRNFPREALKGTLVVTAPPLAVLNGQAAQLAPGARVRDMQNMIVLSGALVGAELKVLYTFDDRGNLKDIWILRPAEAARPWPGTPKEAARWAFDPIAQVWTQR
jgi:hypothetical protein